MYFLLFFFFFFLKHCNQILQAICSNNKAEIKSYPKKQHEYLKPGCILCFSLMFWAMNNETLPLFLMVSSSFGCVPNEINTWFFNTFKSICSKANIHMFLKVQILFGCLVESREVYSSPFPHCRHNHGR